MLDIKKKELEKVVLVGIYNFKNTRRQVLDDLEELELLCSTAGGEVVKIFIQNVPVMNSAYLIGKGKAEEIAAFAAAHNISTIVFDNDLTPVQVRNLENVTNCKVLDRSAVILDIFAAHARTREAKTQVELAQYEYFLPRLTGQWTHLSKQYGGIGTKGPGETQIETDRRIVRNKISALKQKLKEIDTQRETQRKNRKELFKIVLVGYTNVGKSTILNFLTDAKVLVENKLFATLDSTTRHFKLPGGMECLISDTVGFIKKLPHSLVASFRSTLKEITDADLILHIVDAGHPGYQEQIAVVNDTLSELKVDFNKVMIVFNKIDLPHKEDLSRFYPDSVSISAARGFNLMELEKRIEKFAKKDLMEGTLELKISDSYKVGKIKPLCESIQIKYTDEKVIVSFVSKLSNYKKILQSF